MQIAAGTGAAYPPACNASGSLGSYNMNRSYMGPNYVIDYNFIRWDTSALGAAATVTSAALVAYVAAKSNADSRNWQGDWYSWSPPVSCGSYVAAAPTPTAFWVAIKGLGEIPRAGSDAGRFLRAAP